MISTRLALVIVCALAAGVYVNSLENGFALDDTAIIENNKEVHGLERLGEAVTGPYWETGPATAGMYRPLTLATFVVDWEIWNGRPIGFHLTNIVLHVAVTALVLLLLLQLGGGLPGALAGAAIFAVHPVHVEAVANVVGRAEVLATLFFLAACLIYQRWDRGWAPALAIAVLYLLSLLSKEIGATLPGILLLLEWIRHGSAAVAVRRAMERWRTYALAALGLVVYFALRIANIGGLLGGEAPWFFEVPNGTRLWTAIRVWPEYLRLMVIPVDLVPDYGPGVIVPETSPWSGLVLAGLLLALLLGVLVWRLRGQGLQGRLIGGGILWFALTVLPVSNLLFEVGVLLAERTLYLPSVGLALSVTGVLSWVRHRRPSFARPTIATLALLVMAAGVWTWKHNPVWKDTSTVLTDLVVTHPANYRAQWALYSHFLTSGDTARALAHVELASRMVPGYFSVRSDHAELLYALGRWEEAAVEYAAARDLLRTWEPAHLLLVESLIRSSQTEEAVAAGREAVEHLPDNRLAHHQHARALAHGGRYAEAARALTRAISMTSPPERWAQWTSLAGLRLLTGDTASAAVALDSARASAPEGRGIPSLAEIRAEVEREGPAGIPFW